ncbi:MAG: diaminopropionate ammonia-lyase [Paracoccaceae bacterium]|jgi:diaminopropionate ammonia-lyase
MTYQKNPYRGQGLPDGRIAAKGDVRHDPALPLLLLSHCPVAATPPLVDLPELAGELGLARLAIKDERQRMGLGSFKALGAAFAIARAAYARLGDGLFVEGVASTALTGQVYTSATAGNHGLSIAAGARVFGAQAVIYIAETVPKEFETRLKTFGATVVREGENYEASLTAAMNAAEKNGWNLLSDTSWPDYTAPPLDVMEGYLVMSSEAADQVEAEGWQPTHVFLQAGVGGLAAAVAVNLRHRWGEDFQIIVVEPEAAPALQASIEAGKPIITQGPVSNMGRLDCKEPSHLALKALAQAADGFLTVSDTYVSNAIVDLEGYNLKTSPSGGAGYAGLKAMIGDEIGPDARVLLFLSEGPADEL